jgi:hypothetical protein
MDQEHVCAAPDRRVPATKQPAGYPEFLIVSAVFASRMALRDPKIRNSAHLIENKPQSKLLIVNFRPFFASHFSRVSEPPIDSQRSARRIAPAMPLNAPNRESEIRIASKPPRIITTHAPNREKTPSSAGQSFPLAPQFPPPPLIDFPAIRIRPKSSRISAEAEICAFCIPDAVAGGARTGLRNSLFTGRRLWASKTRRKKRHCHPSRGNQL